jgi:hypothetical protein
LESSLITSPKSSSSWSALAYSVRLFGQLKALTSHEFPSLARGAAGEQLPFFKISSPSPVRLHKAPLGKTSSTIEGRTLFESNVSRSVLDSEKMVTTFATIASTCTNVYAPNIGQNINLFYAFRNLAMSSSLLLVLSFLLSASCATDRIEAADLEGWSIQVPKSAGATRSPRGFPSNKSHYRTVSPVPRASPLTGGVRALRRRLQRPHPPVGRQCQWLYNVCLQRQLQEEPPLHRSRTVGGG